MSEEKKEETPVPAPSSSGKNTGMAAICYLGILVFIPMLTKDKNDPFVKFHIKQGLVLLIAYVVTGFIFWIPLVGWAIGVIMFILFIMGIMNALGGKETKLPIIGQFGEKFNI